MEVCNLRVGMRVALTQAIETKGIPRGARGVFQDFSEYGIYHGHVLFDGQTKVTKFVLLAFLEPAETEPVAA